MADIVVTWSDQGLQKSYLKPWSESYLSLVHVETANIATFNVNTATDDYKCTIVK